MTKEEIEKQADKFYPNANVVTHDAIEHQGFVKGAMWMQELFENNRLSHCDSMTEEEYNRESDFVSNFIKEHHRTPTFSDAIEITREQMIDKASFAFCVAGRCCNRVNRTCREDCKKLAEFKSMILEDETE